VTTVLHEEGMKILYRITCRCGYKGEWRKTRYAAFDDRLAHGRHVAGVAFELADVGEDRERVEHDLGVDAVEHEQEGLQGHFLSMMTKVPARRTPVRRVTAFSATA
jgi:hypothetical protein